MIVFINVMSGECCELFKSVNWLVVVDSVGVDC